MFFIYNFFFSLFYFFFKNILFFLSKKYQFLFTLDLKEEIKNVDIWIHGVSAGEIKTSIEIVKVFSKKKVLITTFNQSGYQAFQSFFNEFRNVFFHYAPLDYFFLVKKFINHVNPKKYIIIEHDLWPNTLTLLKKNNTKIFLLNSRFQKKDIQIYKFFPFAFRFLYNKIDTFTIQTKEDKKVIQNFKLKVNQKNIHSIGNLKYNFFQLTQKQKQKQKTIIVLGSSHCKEEEIIIEKLKPFLSKIILVIIPRHLERITEIESLCKKKNLSFQTIKKKEEIKNSSLYLVNSFGQSLHFYKTADIVFIGDTFIPTQGGHNFLEAVSCYAFTCYGKFLVSYSDITHDFEEEEAVLRLDEKQWEIFFEKYLFNIKNREAAIKKSIAILKKNNYDQKKLRVILEH